MNNKCREIRELLSAYIDSELSPELCRFVEEHLKTCPDCRREVDELRQTAGLVRSLPKLKAPVGFTEDVMQKIRQQKRKRSWFATQVFTKVAAAFVVVALSFSAGVMVERTTHQIAGTAAPDEYSGEDKEQIDLGIMNALPGIGGEGVAQSDALDSRAVYVHIPLHISEDRLTAALAEIRAAVDRADGTLPPVGAAARDLAKDEVLRLRAEVPAEHLAALISELTPLFGEDSEDGKLVEFSITAFK